MYLQQLTQTYQTLNKKNSVPNPNLTNGEIRAYNLLNYYFNQTQFNLEEQKIAKGLVAKMLKNKKLLN